jgi:2'-5' RNA ligase
MYTLWLIPDNNTHNKLSELIVDLSSLHDTPQFEPHVTLLGGIVDPLAIAIEKTEKLAKKLAAISASLTRIEFLEIYYRCLFFCTDDSADLMDAHEQAHDLFEHTHINPFIPHISFLYGSLPIFEKQSIISELGDSFFLDFRMTKIRLVKTQRTPEYWQLIKEFELE